MIVARIKSQQLFSRDCVTQVEFVRANHIALRPDAEELRFHRIKNELGRKRLLKDCIQRGSQPFARSFAVCWSVFVPIRNPNVVDAGFAECLADGGSNLPAGDTVLDPELPSAPVGMGERKTIGSSWMRKKRGIQVQAQAVRLCPIDPVSKMLGPQLVSIDFLAVGLGVKGME